VWSTVAIRQHVVLDVAAGAALGVLFGLASARWMPPVGRPAGSLRLSSTHEFPG
jgi:membrane-associated phospholipid phosphatase